ARITRASVLDVQNEDYVRTARAKGLPTHTVDSRHVFRNAMLPISTVIGLQVGLLLSGAVLTETVFAFPVIGSWLQQSIQYRDYPVLQHGLLFRAVIAPLIAPSDPREQHLGLVENGCCPGPSADHLLGVDDLGRDEFSRIVYGARYSLLIGIVSVTVGLTFGLILGAIAGYVRRLD